MKKLLLTVITIITVFAINLAMAISSNASDTTVLQPIQDIPLDGVEGGIDHMAVDISTGRLYVAAIRNNTVEVIDLAAGKRIQTIKGFEEPQGIATIPDFHRVVIASGGDGKCRIYDSSYKLVNQVDELEDADNVRYDTKLKQAVVGNGKDQGALAFIDVLTGMKISEIKLDAHPESFQLEANGNRIFVNIPKAAHVAVVDRAKHAVVAKWTITDAKSNFPMALDEANHRLFIGCRKPAKLLVLDTDSGKTVASIDIMEDTDDIFYDGASSRIYVSGGGGSVSVIRQSDADHYAVIGDVPTSPGARTALFVAATSKLYVAAPHRDLHQAQIKVFSAPRPLILKQRIPLPQVSGGFNHHAADGKNRHVFLCASANKTVEVLDLTTGRIINSLQQKNRPAATCFTPGINILSVSCGDTVNLYDGDSFKELAVITMPSSIDELRCDSKTNQLFAGCMTISNYGIATIDLVQRKSLGITKSPPPQGFCLEDDGNRIFICSPKTDQVSIVDRNKSAVVDSIKLDDPKGGNPVAYDPATHRLFVGCRKPAKLLVLNTDNGKTIASVDMGMGTDDLSFDPINKRIYVACSQGVISVIQQDNADHFRNIADVPTASGARNCVFIPESGEFCVTVPQSKDQSQPAAVLIYQAQPVK